MTKLFFWWTLSLCLAQQEFDEQEFLQSAKKHTELERTRTKNFALVKEKIRPRGASLDGRYAVFEKRSITHPQLIEFIVFDATKGTRSFFLSPTQKKGRQKVLDSIEQETQWIENTIYVFQNINRERAIVSFTYAEVLFEIYRDPTTQNLLLDIWKLLPLQKRQLFCRYPISNSPFVSGKIEKIYSFDNNNGFAVQIFSQQFDQASVDILSFHLEKGFSVVTSEQLAKQTFILASKDYSTMFLKDIHFMLGEDKRIEKQRLYFLGGLSKEIFPTAQPSSTETRE